MANKPKFQRPALERAVAALHDLRERGELTPDRIKQASHDSGYSVRHIRRVLNRPSSPDTSQGTASSSAAAFTVTEQVIIMVFLYCGVMAKAYRELKRQGTALPSLRTFQRKIVAAVGTAQLAYARGGTAAFREAQVYLKQNSEHRMNSLLLDHTELPIYVVPRGHKRAEKPWMTAVMDGHTRYILSWVITWGRPSAEEVRAALIQAMSLRVAPDGETVVGGRPLKAVWDRGLEFLSTLITESCLRLHVMPVPLPAYSPHLKGRLERFWDFLNRDLLSPLPGYTQGPRDLRGRTALESHAIGEDELLVLVADWMDYYLTEHANADTRRTPLQMWQADATPLDRIADEQLWQDFLISKDRCKVSKNGIRWDTIDWIAPELIDARGRHVEIRYLPHDRTFIEVFLDGVHLCTAVPNGSADDETAHQLLVKRAETRKRALQRFTTANRLRRSGHDELHPLEITKDGKRVVTDLAEDLMVDVDEALERLLEQPDGDGPVQGRLL
jgi:putative transposase